MQIFSSLKSNAAKLSIPKFTGKGATEFSSLFEAESELKRLHPNVKKKKTQKGDLLQNNYPDLLVYEDSRNNYYIEHHGNKYYLYDEKSGFERFFDVIKPIQDFLDEKYKEDKLNLEKSTDDEVNTAKMGVHEDYSGIFKIIGDPQDIKKLKELRDYAYSKRDSSRFFNEVIFDTKNKTVELFKK